MGEFAKTSDGRRIFTLGFKRRSVERLRSGESTVAGEDGVSASRVRQVEKQVQDLQRLVGEQAMTVEIPEAVRGVVKQTPKLVRGFRR
jgi:hypothetical protein